MRAMLFVLVAFAHADGHFDASERASSATPSTSSSSGAPTSRSAATRRAERRGAALARALLPRDHEHRERGAGEPDRERPVGESAGEYVAGQLKLRCFELLQTLGAGEPRGAPQAGRRSHPRRRPRRPRRAALPRRDRAAVRRRADAPLRARARTRAAAAPTILDEPRARPLRERRSPFLPRRRDPATRPIRPIFAHQAAADIELIRQVERAPLGAPRARARAPRRRGDVHGVRGAGAVPRRVGVRRAAAAGRRDRRARPRRSPRLLLVPQGRADAGRLLRPRRGLPPRSRRRRVSRCWSSSATTSIAGAYSYDGILRTVLRLFLAAPEHVFVLRGNHEQYMIQGDRIESPVRAGRGDRVDRRRSPRARSSTRTCASSSAAERRRARRDDLRPRRHPARGGAPREAPRASRRSTTPSSASRWPGAIRATPTTCPPSSSGRTPASRSGARSSGASWRRSAARR